MMSTAPAAISRRTPWLVISDCPAVIGMRVFARTRAISAASSYQWHGSSNQRMSSGSTRCAKAIASSAFQPRLASQAMRKSGPAALRAAAARSGARAPLGILRGEKPPHLDLAAAQPGAAVGLHLAADVAERLALHVVTADRD